jgi:hypothetical protein
MATQKTITEETTMFYVIESEHNLKEDEHLLTIQTCPGRTNQGREAKLNGWLGTTNDLAEYALGRFATLEEARNAVMSHSAILERGYREDESAAGQPVEFDADGNVIGEIVERYKVGLQPYAAADFFSDNTAAVLGITAETTDEDIKVLAAEYEKDCQQCADSALIGAYEYLRNLRDELKMEV